MCTTWHSTSDYWEGFRKSFEADIYDVDRNNLRLRLTSLSSYVYDVIAVQLFRPLNSHRNKNEPSSAATINELIIRNVDECVASKHDGSDR